MEAIEKLTYECRFLFAMYALYEGLVLSPADVLYSPLPMYHTAAGLMVTGAAMAEGLSSVSRSGESLTPRHYHMTTLF